MSNPWWRRRKKRNRWFNDIYDELEKLEDMLDETMRKALDSVPDNNSVKPDHVRGFSIKIGPDGRPRIREFNANQPLDDEADFSDDLEPLVDLIEKEGRLVVLVSLPGISKEEIDLRVTEGCLTVSVDAAEFEWYDEFKLPTKVRPKTARASYKNGVLEVSLEKLEKKVKDDRISMK